MTTAFQKICDNILHDPANKTYTNQGILPLYTADSNSKIVIVGQAPGSKAQLTNKVWNDKSGVLLREWLGVSELEFYNPDLFAVIPMDFYYPGKSAHGDLPPRKEFAAKWHPQLFANMPNVQLTILIGAYSQKYYLHNSPHKNLTENVRHFQDFLPKYFPLAHPSPLNFRWRANNPWFDEKVIPNLRELVGKIILQELA